MSFIVGGNKPRTRVGQQWQRLSSSINYSDIQVQDDMMTCHHIKGFIMVSRRVNPELSDTKHRYTLHQYVQFMYSETCLKISGLFYKKNAKFGQDFVGTHFKPAGSFITKQQICNIDRI